MATGGADDIGDSRRRIILDNVIYEPVSSVVASRQQRSQLSMYNDYELSRMEPYKYKALRSMRRRLRLLRLHGGGLLNPEITCELFEVEYDKDDQNIVRRVLSKDERSAKRERYEKRRQSGKAPDHSSGAQSLDFDNAVVEYEALSWCWGQEVKDRAIRIQEGGKYYRLAVTRDLTLALKYLRHPHEERILWIDALCINQANHEERNHQVQMMARIYSGAKQACIWLGEDTDDSTTAITFIRQIVTLENLDDVLDKRENASKWQSLLLLMQRPWFSRRWVVQEIALARSATIYCGNDNIPWRSFAVTVELLVEIETASHRLSEVVRKDGNVPQWFEHISELGASVLVQATGKVFRRDGNQVTDLQEHFDPQIRYTARNGARKPRHTTRERLAGLSRPPALALQRPLLSLEYLVSSSSVFQASQPRDAVYSLLAISRDAIPLAELQINSQEGSEEAIIMSTLSSFLERKPFRVDYSRTYSDVCKDFVSFCIQMSGRSDPTRALDILCRPWAPEPEVAAGGVIHRKPTLYKFLPSYERDCLWPVGKDRRPTFCTFPKYHPKDIIWEIEPDSQQQIGAPMLREPDKRSTAEYWAACEEDWKQNFPGRVLTFERDVKPFLPEREGPPKTEEVGEQEDPEVSEQSESEGEGVENDYEEQTDKDVDIPLASWICRISKAAFALYRHPGMHKLGRIGRMNADPLVGLPEDGHKRYRAAQNGKVDFDSGRRLRFRKRPFSGHCSLFTEGFILATVETVAEPARLGAIPETWTKVAGWENAVDGQTDPPVEFWRTLVADRGKDGRNAPYYYAMACRESVRRGGLRGGSVDTGALINSERNSIIAEFCRRVQAVIWNRRLIKTDQPLNVLGLAGEHVRGGDLVCILFGCTVPVILRRVRKARGDREKEKMQDRVESMKAAMAMCEEACFRKIRYQKRLQEEQAKGEHLGRLWKQEVLAELKEVNGQKYLWRKREEEDRKRKWDQYNEEEIRKKNSDYRQSIAKRRRLSAAFKSPQSRSDFMPDPRLRPVAKDTASIVVDKGIAEDPEGFGSTGTVLPQTHGQDNQDGTKKTKQDTPEQLEEEKQRKKNQAKEEDPNIYYQFMGEAYIHGMMDGEAVRLQINEGIPRRMFEIR